MRLRVDRAIVPQVVTFTAILFLFALAVYMFTSRSFLSVDVILAFIGFALVAFAFIALYVRLRFHRAFAWQAAAITLCYLVVWLGTYFSMSRPFPSTYLIFAVIAFTFITVYCCLCARQKVV